MCTIDDGETCEVWTETSRMARKIHKCDACGGRIDPGQLYVVHFSIFEGDIQRAKMCAACQLVRDQFGESHGHILPFPGTLREMLQECILDGDEESEVMWKPALEAMDARRSSARVNAGCAPARRRTFRGSARRRPMI